VPHGDAMRTENWRIGHWGDPSYNTSITPLFPDVGTRRNKEEKCEKRGNWMYLVLEATVTQVTGFDANFFPCFLTPLVEKKCNK